MANSVEVQVLFFAKSRELVGARESVVQLDREISPLKLKEDLISKYPQMDYIDIVEDKLDVTKITNLVTSPSCGAVSLFIGTTRDNFDGKKVLRLEYEAYIPMAKKKMKEVCDQMRQKWDIHSVAMFHRIGVVPVTEASIAIAVSSSHRKESLEAIQYGIDIVKAIVPIWKKEIYDDDSSTWKENKECEWASSNKQ